MKNTIAKVASILTILCITVSMNAQDKDKKSTENKNQISIVIPNDASQTKLDKVVDDLKAAGVTLEIKNVKRDDSGKIIGMSLKATTKKGNLSSSYSQRSDSPLNPVQITYDSSPLLFIGSVGKNGMTKIFSSTHNNDDDVFIFSADDDAAHPKRMKLRKTVRIEKDEHNEEHEENTWVSKDGEVEKSATKEEAKQKEKTFLYRTNSKGKPLFVVDGKEVMNIEDINSDDIAAIYVLKDKKAIDKYGGKGKNGVVEIITKK